MTDVLNERLWYLLGSFSLKHKFTSLSIVITKQALRPIHEPAAVWIKNLLHLCCYFSSNKESPSIAVHTVELKCRSYVVPVHHLNINFRGVFKSHQIWVRGNISISVALSHGYDKCWQSGLRLSCKHTRADMHTATAATATLVQHYFSNSVEAFSLSDSKHYVFMFTPLLP